MGGQGGVVETFIDIHLSLYKTVTGVHSHFRWDLACFWVVCTVNKLKAGLFSRERVHRDTHYCKSTGPGPCVRGDTDSRHSTELVR